MTSWPFDETCLPKSGEYKVERPIYLGNCVPSFQQLWMGRGRLFKRTAQKLSKASCRLSCLLAKGQLEAFCPCYQSDFFRGPTCQNQNASVGKPLQRQAISKPKGSRKHAHRTAAVELVGSDCATPAVSSASSVSSTGTPKVLIPKAAAAVQATHSCSKDFAGNNFTPAGILAMPSLSTC